MLADCRARLANDPDAEIEVATGEERRIGRLRLERLLTTEGQS
jgi:2-oxo-4-hydroxy-4-carboxy--5-ureidoimidazoline (OHCU) decarboxylase